MTKHILDELYEVLEQRKAADPKKSYVSSLYKKGSKKIAKKLGEEAVELVIEAMRYEGKEGKKTPQKRFTAEAADLLFHYLVLLSYHDIPLQDVYAELQTRLGVGGFEEKAARNAGPQK